MNFTFSDDQTMMAEAARQILMDTCTSERLRAQMAQGAARDEARWAALAENGLTAVMAPERVGGLGLEAPDFVRIAEAAGYVALPEPLVEHAGVALPLLAAAAPDHPWLAEAVEGGRLLAIGHSVNPFVADADTAGGFLLADGDAVHLLSSDQIEMRRQESLDPFRRLFRLDWAPSAATRIADGEAGAALWRAALDRGALFSAAQCLGLAQRSVDLAVAYARERHQFGKPIGAYQAVKHQLATAQVKIEFARPVVHAASAVVAQDTLQSRARVSHAKIVAAEAADVAARTAIQVHGAMGYSWEVDVHLFLKRALALTYAWGDPSFHQRRVQARIFGAPVGADQTFLHEATHG